METRYMDKISDKRTIAQKFGDKTIQEKKLKENPKYKQIAKVVDTGSTIKNTQFVSDQLISKRKSELFKRVKGSTIIKLIKSAKEKQTESIYNLGNGDQNINNQNIEEQKDDNKSVISNQTNKSNMTNVTAVTYATEMLGNLNEIDFIILDLREESEYERIHVLEAVSFPGVNISRDKFTQQLIMMKNKPGKMIIMYHTDERNGIPYANNFFQKGYDNVYFLSGGIEEFEKYHPEYLDGPEKDKYINMKKERERQNKIAEEKKLGKSSKYHLCGQMKNESINNMNNMNKSNISMNNSTMSKNNSKNISTLKKNLEKK
jgi:centrosomal protein CEP41